MSITAHQANTDETSFGIGGVSSHDADAIASGAYGAPLWVAESSADEVVENSHQADISAAYDSSAKRPVVDGTGLHR